MMTILCFLCVCLFYVYPIYGQSLIKGDVVEGGDVTKKLTNSSVMLVQAKDSILIDFTRTDENGKFSITKPDSIPSLLIVSYPKFGTFFQEIGRASCRYR